MKQQVRVIRDTASRFGDPLSLYKNGHFVRLHRVQRQPSEAGKGHRYYCTVRGQPMELWQERERDVWYLAECPPENACG